MEWIAAVYLAGVVAGLLLSDARPLARIGLALLWPLGPLAFVLTVGILLAASVIAFPAVAAAVLATLAALTIAISAFAQSPAVPPPAPAGWTRIVDLGHPLRPGDPSWDGNRAFEREGTRRNGRFRSEEHFGTHLDAPSHFGGAWTVEQIPADRLVRPGVCINVTGKPEDYQVTVADLEAFEARHGGIPDAAVVLIATGWDARWPDRKAYINERGGRRHFPGISAAAARYLVQRKVAGIGIDTPSVDYGPSETFETHNITNPANIYHVENARGLTALPPRGFTVIIAPINLAGGSGGPTRMFALLP